MCVNTWSQSLARPNTGRSYFEEKREDLFQKYVKITTEEAGLCIAQMRMFIFVYSMFKFQRQCYLYQYYFPGNLLSLIRSYLCAYNIYTYMAVYFRDTNTISL